MKNRKGFTLIELMIVIAIIAIIAAIAIPGILSARKSANANAAFANLKSFCTAMVAFQNDDPAQKYPNTGTTAFAHTTVEYATLFGKYFNQPANNIKNGYYYFYFTPVETVTSAGSKYVYIAFPTSANNGTKGYVVDESNRIWEAVVSSDTLLIKAPGIGAGTTVDPFIATKPADAAAWANDGAARFAAWANVSTAGWIQKT